MRLIGENIPHVGRIVAVADVLDALTHIRPYKSAWTLAEAVAEIERQRGSQFDPAVVDALLALHHEHQSNGVALREFEAGDVQLEPAWHFDSGETTEAAPDLPVNDWI